MKTKSPGYYQRQRLRAWERDRGRCVVCGGEGTQIHHRQGRGGPDPHRMQNLILVDDDCHRRIHGNPAWAYEHGYMVRRHGVVPPERVPVVINHLPVWLSPDGLSHPQRGAADAHVLG